MTVTVKPLTLPADSKQNAPSTDEVDTIFPVSIADTMEITGINDKIFEPEEEVLTSSDGSKIAEFYSGRYVFLTGATGFFGKLLVEKLLRTCTGIEGIVILVRDKKGVDVHSRVDKLYDDEIFNKLAQAQPKFRHKIIVAKGDMNLPGLGLSNEDTDFLKDKVSVIIHAAATVRFDEKIKLAAEINVRGTKEILDLARQCPKLVSFVHVSTAFANCVHKKIDEVFYEPPYDTESLMKLVESTPEDVLQETTPKILGNYPNTYALTKAVAEKTVSDYGRGLPICIVRPSIVVPTYKEPFRGWIDNIYGPTGVAMGAGLGILRTLHCDKDCLAEIVPGDFAINAILAASYKNTLQKTDDIPIYNYVSAVEQPITWGTFMELMKKYGLQVPSMKSIWYYNLTLNKNKYINAVYIFFLHTCMAVIFDTLAYLSGSKPQLIKAYKKVHKFSNVLSYFSTQEWKFTNNNTQRLWEEMPDVDKKLFPFSMKLVDWDYHAQTYIPGIRVYFVKESLSNLAEAKKRWTRLKYLHYTVKYLTLFIVLRILYSILYYTYSSIFNL